MPKVTPAWRNRRRSRRRLQKERQRSKALLGRVQRHPRVSGAAWVRPLLLSARRSDVGRPMELNLDGRSNQLAPQGALTA